MKLELSPFQEVLADFRAGKPVIMVDDEKRENEGDLILAADLATPESINFMLQEARGLVCVSLGSDRANALNLPLQTLNNNSAYQTPFAVSVDHVSVVTLGVTARARAHTINRLIHGSSQASDFISPGHVFPLIAHPAGVMGRQGQTEGSYDLARIADLAHAAVLCEILNPDGTMMRNHDLADYAKHWGIKLTSVGEVVRHRVNHEVLVREAAAGRIGTDYGEFSARVFIDDVDGKEHIVLLCNEPKLTDPDFTPLVRIHSECLTGDVFGSRRCDCGAQLAKATEQIKAEGAGLIIYLRQEGRGIGLGNKVKAYALQDNGSDTFDANVALGFKPDERDYAVAAKILSSLGIEQIRLLTNNPDKVSTLTGFGVKVAERVSIIAEPDEMAADYLATKRKKFGHWL